MVKTSGPTEGNPLPIGTQVRDPFFLELAAMRLTRAASLDFQDTRAAYGLIVTVRNLVSRGDANYF